MSNGYMGIRGTIDEPWPSSNRGTFLNGFYETFSLTYVEEGFGFAKTGQTMVNVPDATIFRVTIDNEPLDITASDVIDCSRVLDLHRGVLRRTVTWSTASGRTATLISERVVSFAERHLAMISWDLVVDGRAQVEIATEVRDLEDLALTDATHHRDPRKGLRFVEPVLEQQTSEVGSSRVLLTYRTKRSGLALAVGAHHSIDSTMKFDEESAATDHGAEIAVRYTSEAGEPLRLSKLISYHHGASVDDLAADVGKVLDRAALAGPNAVRSTHESVAKTAWAVADVEVGAPLRVQQAIRWNVFQLIQATIRLNGSGIPAKGLSSAAYGGHYFWDDLIYVLPFLVYTNPANADHVLRHRYRMLDQARARARQMDQRGALFPWRTINGEEASAYYPAGTAQYHINAAIMLALKKYVEVTGDTDWLIEGGAEMIFETARLWADLGFIGNDGCFHISGVTGPDEYTAMVDDNAYTNLVARRHLRYAYRVWKWLQQDATAAGNDLARRIDLGDDEAETWRTFAESMAVPVDETLGVVAQDDGFMDREGWDLATTPPERFPLLLNYHPLVIYRYQVLKQPDVVLAMVLLGDEFDFEEKRRNFDYYDPITTGDSSLSACVQSIAAAEIGYDELALDYFEQGVYTDLADTHGNTDDGVHQAAVGGTWMNLVYGFGGVRDYDGAITIDPHLPAEWSMLNFPLQVRGTSVEVEVDHEGVTLTHQSGPPLDVTVAGNLVVLADGHVERVRI